MKGLKLLGVLIFFSISTQSFSQKDETILTIGSQNFSSGEFWHIYNKNKHLPGFNESPQEFSSRFINYKLKVVEAMAQGLDTLHEFKTEFTNYRDELAESFLVDSAAMEKTFQESYNNMTRIVNASHILIKFPKDPTPSDTLKAWKKISELKDKVTQGEDFNELASKFSEDGSVTRNQGKIGYFSAFQMVYPFEKGAFETHVGEVSSIVRSVYGYHIIKIHENIPNPGKIRVAHIMTMTDPNQTPEIEAKAKALIDSIYNEIKNGGNFDELAQKHSQDHRNAKNSGEMKPFGLNDMVPEFAFAAFKLTNDGEISEPIKTPYGWHIIKRLELQPIGDYKTVKPTILSMMGKDERSQMGHKAFIDGKRKAPNFKINTPVWDEIAKVVESGEISKEDFFKSVNRSTETLFSYFSTSVSAASFIEYLEKNQSFSTKEGTKGLEKAIKAMSEPIIKNVEKEKLASVNKQFKYLSNEYHDGLLIFELSNREIWSKADADSAVLSQYYQQNIQEFSTLPTLVGTQCYLTDSKLIKSLTKAVKKAPKTSVAQLLEKKAASVNDYRCNEGKFPFINKAINPVPANSLPESNTHFKAEGVVFWQGTVQQGDIIAFENCRGSVISSYQNNLEKEWVEKLKGKHNPVFNQKVLKKTSSASKK